MSEQNTISFVLDGRIVSVDLRQASQYTPTTTVLEYLRSRPEHLGVKEGCAEGDCGACTVVIGELLADGGVEYKAVNSCLMFLPALHGRHLITVENVAQRRDALHPIQQAMVEQFGSQCGFCTPGIIMSLYGLWLSTPSPARDEIADALAGNLCRCTGYRPIIAAAESAFEARTSRETDELTRIASRLLPSLARREVKISTGTMEYCAPTDPSAAVAFLKRRPDAVIVQGGTDVGLRVTKGHAIFPAVLDLSRVAALREFHHDGGTLTFGSGMTINEVARAGKDQLPELGALAATFGSKQIRNLGTLGGNLATASPVGDSLPLLLAYQAVVLAEGPKGRREIPLNEFIVAYRKTALQPGELITGVRIEIPRPATVVKFYKVSKRRDVDIATLSGAFRLERSGSGTIERAVIAFGGMDARPRRSNRIESSLAGKEWSRGTVEAAAKALEADFQPLSDVRGTKEFRLTAAKNLLTMFWHDTSNGGGRL